MEELKDRVAYVLVFDGFADWEPALALCEINKPSPMKQRRFDVAAVGFSKEPVTSMGGMRITPDITLAELKPERTAIFIVPGGDRWETSTDDALVAALLRLREAGVPVAAICAATLVFGRAGILRGVRHTSNTKSYLPKLAQGYKDEGLYVEQLAVSDKGVITASGLGSVEFANEIIKELGIYDEPNRRAWFDLFKHGIVPPGMA